MKKILFAMAIVTTFAACKGKTDQTKLDSNKDLILLQDSASKSSYLTDTGVAVTAATRNADNNVSKAPVRHTGGGGNNASSGSGSSNSSTASSGSSNTSTGTTTAPAPAPQKKGISKAAKGAIIGGVGGAVVGAVAGKGKGAVIGGVVGATGGYIIGRGKDKKDGRVQ